MYAVRCSAAILRVEWPHAHRLALTPSRRAPAHDAHAHVLVDAQVHIHAVARLEDDVHGLEVVVLRMHSARQAEQPASSRCAKANGAHLGGQRDERALAELRLDLHHIEIATRAHDQQLQNGSQCIVGRLVRS
jgi:hypothetical protein